MSGRSVRRSYFVQRGLQGRFIAVFCLLCLLGAAATAAATAILARGTLREAMFRAHFAERSTGEIVLPVLVGVNAVGAVAVAACGLAAAAWLFRRQSRALDHLCAWLAARRDELARGAAPSEAPTPGTSAPPDWAAELRRAFADADGAVRAAYRAAAEEASELTSAAARIAEALGAGAQEDGLAGDLTALEERIAGVGAALSRHADEGAE